LRGFNFQALEKWGNWGQIAPGVSNGQSEIKFTKLEFARPEPVAAQFDPDEGFTGGCHLKMVLQHIYGTDQRCEGLVSIYSRPANPSCVSIF